MSDGILFFDGFEGDTTASVWQGIDGGFLQTDMIDPQWARTGGYGYGFVGGGIGGAQSCLWTPTDYIIIGFAFLWHGQGGGTQGDPIMQLRGPGDVVHVGLNFNTQNVFGFLKPDGNMLWSVRTLDADAWYYIELRAKIHNTTGSVELWINGGADIAVTGLDTAGGGDPNSWFVNQFHVGRLGGYLAGQGPTHYQYDDFYVMNANVTPTPLGDSEVLGYALQDDASVMFSRSSGSKNYQLVDDTTPDEDATYVYSDVDNAEDYYVVGDTSYLGTIHAVQLVIRCRKTATQIWTIQGAIELTGTKSYGIQRYMAYPNYETLQPYVFGDAPGSTGWTVGQFNAMTVGFRIQTP